VASSLPFAALRSSSLSIYGLVRRVLFGADSGSSLLLVVHAFLTLRSDGLWLLGCLGGSVRRTFGLSLRWPSHQCVVSGTATAGLASVAVFSSFLFSHLSFSRFLSGFRAIVLGLIARFFPFLSLFPFSSSSRLFYLFSQLGPRWVGLSFGSACGSPPCLALVCFLPLPMAFFPARFVAPASPAASLFPRIWEFSARYLPPPLILLTAFFVVWVSLQALPAVFLGRTGSVPLPRFVHSPSLDPPFPLLRYVVALLSWTALTSAFGASPSDPSGSTWGRQACLGRFPLSAATFFIRSSVCPLGDPLLGFCAGRSNGFLAMC